MDKGNRELPAEITETPESTLPTPRWWRLPALITVSIIVLFITGVLIYLNLRYVWLESELDRYESLWTRQEISNYDYTLIYSSMWSDWDVVIQVRDGITTSVIITNRYMDDEDYNPTFDSRNTIPKLFDSIRNSIRDRGDIIKVTYNPNFGYPMDVYIDTWLDAVDDEIFFGVSDFHIIESGE